MRFAILLLIFFAIGANATEKLIQKKPLVVDRRLYVGAALQARMEGDIENSFTVRSIPSLSLGYVSEEFVYLFETGRFNVKSGNPTLSVDRKVENMQLSVIWDTAAGRQISPYVVAGAGVLREVIQTNLFESSYKTASPWAPFGEFGMGLRLTNWTRVWMSPEVKLMFGDRLQPNPQLSANLRFGFLF